MNERLHTEGAIEALRMAIDRQRPPPGLIHHTDRGIQYASEAYRRALAATNIIPSMSRKGDCRDNAPMECFFTPSKLNAFITVTTPLLMNRGGTCSDMSRAFIIPVACTLLRAIYPRPTTSAERHNPVNFFGGRSHATIDKALGSTTYFANPYSRGQRGSNENLKGLIRQYIPKSQQLSNVIDAELAKIERLLNTLPRKRLGYKTPLEVFTNLLKRVALRA